MSVILDSFAPTRKENQMSVSLREVEKIIIAYHNPENMRWVGHLAQALIGKCGVRDIPNYLAKGKGIKEPSDEYIKGWNACDALNEFIRHINKES